MNLVQHRLFSSMSRGNMLALREFPTSVEVSVSAGWPPIGLHVNEKDIRNELFHFRKWQTKITIILTNEPESAGIQLLLLNCLSIDKNYQSINNWQFINKLLFDTYIHFFFNQIPVKAARVRLPAWACHSDCITINATHCSKARETRREYQSCGDKKRSIYHREEHYWFFAICLSADYEVTHWSQYIQRIRDSMSINVGPQCCLQCRPGSQIASGAMLRKYWFSVYNAGSTPSQHWVNIEYIYIYK